MTRRFHRCLPFLAVVAAAAPGPAQATRPAAGREGEREPHLIVLVVVDQLTADSLTRFAGALGDDGFERVRREGAWCAEAAYRHACTETGPGHATIATGGWGRDHGIVANEWLDPDTHKNVYCVAGSDGLSPENLVGTTLGDQIKLAFGERSTVDSHSLKDRAAILLGGRLADAAWWFERDQDGIFATAPFYRRRTSDIGRLVADSLGAFNAATPRVVDQWRGQPWSRLLDPHQPGNLALYAGLMPDDNAFEKPPIGGRARFDHVFPADGAAYYFHVAYSPMGNDLLLAATLRVLRDPRVGLGRRAGLDLLCVSFSSTDYVGHAYGPHSHEALDVLARVDRNLGELMRALDTTPGRGRWTLALTSDHGVTPIPEYAASLGLPAQRMDMDGAGGVLDRLARHLAHRFADRLPHDFKPVVGAGQDGGRTLVKSPFGKFHEAELWLDHKTLDSLGIPLATAAYAARDFLAREPGCADAWVAADLAREDHAPGSLAERMGLAWFPGRSGDVMCAMAPGCLAAQSKPAFATTHGTPWAYDQRVPVMFIGPGIKSGAVYRRVSPADVAPTLCARFGLVEPSVCRGTPIGEALR